MLLVLLIAVGLLVVFLALRWAWLKYKSLDNTVKPPLRVLRFWNKSGYGDVMRSHAPLGGDKLPDSTKTRAVFPRLFKSGHDDNEGINYESMTKEERHAAGFRPRTK